MIELPLRDRRHPARRPLDRPADQDRAGRPAAGDVRPQRRVADAGHRRATRPATASTSAIEAARIAVKYMTPVILLSRRLHRQRRRAVAASRRSTTCPRSRSSSAPIRRASCPTSATRRRWRARGPSRARPGSSTASAASRRRTSPATSATTRRTTSTWSHLRAEKVARHRATTSRRRRGRTATAERRPAGRRLGPHLRRDHAAPCDAARTRAPQVGHAPPAPPEPAARRTSARSCSAIERVLVPELNLGQLACCSARRYLVDAVALPEGPGQAVQAVRRSRRKIAVEAPAEQK